MINVQCALNNHSSSECFLWQIMTLPLRGNVENETGESWLKFYENNICERKTWLKHYENNIVSSIQETKLPLSGFSFFHACFQYLEV